MLSSRAARWWTGARGAYERLMALRGRRWVTFAAPLAFFFLIALFAQVAAVHSKYRFGLWAAEGGIICLNIALIGLFVAFFHSLTNRFRLACLLTLAMAFTASLAHWMKVAILGEPLFPWDLALVGETAQVIDFSCLLGYWPNAIYLALIAVVMVRVYRVLPRPGRARLRTRIATLCLCLASFASWFSPTYSIYEPVEDTILHLTWSPKESYARSGVLLGFTVRLQDWYVWPPDGYDKDAVVAIYENLPPQKDPPKATAQQPVNLIVILAEAFWDVTALEGVTFGDGDPIPTFRMMARQHGRLDLVAPVFGGGTCNSELEILTGCNMAFFPPGTSPYKYYIRQELPSIASVLRHRGYHTVALHGTTESYFNDCSVQPRLGFELFHPAPRWKEIIREGYVDESGKLRESYYVSDRATYGEAIRLTQEFKRTDPDKPFFLSINTMQTHWPYQAPDHEFKDSAKQANMSIEGIDLKGKLRKDLETYVCCLRQADKALAGLIEHFKTVDTRPTLIVFYGDHLPSLGDDYGVYRKTGFWRDERTDPLRFKTTPVVFWSNFDAKLPSNTGPTLPGSKHQTISMCYLAPLAVRMTNTPLPPFFRFLDACRARYPVLSISGCLNAAGQPVPLAEALDDKLLRDYRLLQYDRVFGEQYFRIITGQNRLPSTAQNKFGD